MSATGAPRAPATAGERIEAARALIAPFIHRTPLLSCRAISRLAGGRVWLKCENFQRGGAFKARGAHHAVFRLDDAVAARGVITHSSGNHGQALALAARARGIPAYVVMPENAPAVKRRGVLAYGGRVRACAPTMAARVAVAEAWAAETGATMVPPFDHVDIIAGQATLAREILEDRPEVDAIVAPVGGGGLVSGLLLGCAALATSPDAAPVPVYGAEPLGADDAARSLAAGQRITDHRPQTIADGLRTHLGELTWPIVRDRIAGIHTVTEEEIVEAMRLLFERAKLVVEPSGAVALAAVLQPAFAARGHQDVCVVLSGGNVDLGLLGQLFSPSPESA